MAKFVFQQERLPGGVDGQEGRFWRREPGLARGTALGSRVTAISIQTLGRWPCLCPLGLARKRSDVSGISPFLVLGSLGAGVLSP